MTQGAPEPQSLDPAQVATEKIRARSADVMLAVYRLVKTSFLHSGENAALRDAANQSANMLRAFSTEIGGTSISLSFIGETIFVCGQLLRATRPTYEAAAELGSLLARVGISELTIDASVDAQRMQQLGAELVGAIRESSERPLVLTLQTRGVEGRQIDPELLAKRLDRRSAAEEILHLYATALVTLRQLYADIATGAVTSPHRQKRLAQRFVILAEREDPAMLGLTTMAKAHRDDPGRALHTAVLALAMTRQITRDRMTLVQIVMSALLLDGGRARIQSRVGDRLLSEREEASVVPAAAFASIATGGVNAANMRRTALITEASWMERTDVLGPIWRGELQPGIAAQILHTARAVLERVAPRDGGRALSPFEAVEAVLSSRAGGDPTVGRLLLRALGMIPAGTVVELSSGAWAVVLGPSRSGPQNSVVRVITDEKGRELQQKRTLDLGVDQSVGIEKIIDQDRARFNTTSTFIDPS